MLFNLAQTLRSLTTSPVSKAVDQAHRMARGRLEAGGPAVSACGRPKSATRRPVHVPVRTQPARGFRSLTLDLPEAFVDRLTELGHLRPEARGDQNEVLWRSTDSSKKARSVARIGNFRGPRVRGLSFDALSLSRAPRAGRWRRGLPPKTRVNSRRMREVPTNDFAAEAAEVRSLRDLANKFGRPLSHLIFESGTLKSI
jgi:hypothetical protein